MPLVINSNIPSLNSQRQLVKSGMEQDQAMERLSSGKKINTAADDAAGLAISNRQTAQIRGLDRAVANANDGVSMIQTAEGALDETTNILQRMRELSIQSANGIYSDSDRATLDAEVQQLKSELDRIADTTSFNGQNLLDGTLGEVELQVGAQANQTIGFEIGAVDTASLGGGGVDLAGSSLSVTMAAMSVTGAVTINGVVLTGASINAAASINTDTLVDVLSVGGVTASTFVDQTATKEGNGVLSGAATLSIALTTSDGDKNIYEIQNTSSMDELVDAINEAAGGSLTASLDEDGHLNIAATDNTALVQMGTTGVSVSLVAGFTDSLLTASIGFSSDDGEGVTISYGTAADAGKLGISERDDAGVVTGVAATVGRELREGELTINGVEIGGSTSSAVSHYADAINEKSAETGVVATINTAGTILTLSSVDHSEISIDFEDNAKLSLEALTGLQESNNSLAAGGAVSSIDISTAAGAQRSIDTIDRALEEINSTRADLGAVNNRLDFTTSNLMNISENTAAARSRIMDADFAAETANLSRAQVLQQASSAMLAQANAAPQQVLSLLR